MLFSLADPHLWADDAGVCRQLASILVDREKKIEAFDVYVGINNLEVATRYTKWFEINKVILHPTYEFFHPVGGDVALVQLKSAITFSDFVLPVCLPPSNLNLNNVPCWAAGWGLVSPQGTS